MEGLFFYHDSDGITYLNFYPDGRIISYGKYTKLNQPLQTFPGYSEYSDESVPVIPEQSVPPFSRWIAGLKLNIFLRFRFS